MEEGAVDAVVLVTRKGARVVRVVVDWVGDALLEAATVAELCPLGSNADRVV